MARDNFFNGKSVSYSRNSALKSVDDALRDKRINKESANKIKSGLWKIASIWMFGKMGK